MIIGLNNSNVIMGDYMGKDILRNETYINDLLKAYHSFDLSKLKNTKILITGGLGLIGSTIVDLLHISNLNIRIFIADINENFYKQRYETYSDISYIKYDALKDINFEIKVDYIINCAGIASPELYVTKPVETMLSNFSGVLNLLKYSNANNVKRMLYVSSSEVYGIKTSFDSFIESEFGSININDIRSSYSEAKRASELLCKSFSKEYGLDIVIVRPGHIFGPTASPNDKRISSAFCYSAAKGDNLYMKSSGIQKRSYCYSIDCAMQIILVLLQGKNCESYNVGHSEITTIKEMADIVAKAGNVKLIINQIQNKDDFANPMNNSSLNINKIKQLGYNEIFSVNEGLTHTIQILKEII